MPGELALSGSALSFGYLFFGRYQRKVTRAQRESVAANTAIAKPTANDYS
jgi:hypothetical protein